MRGAIATAFADWARFVLRHPRAVLVPTLAVAAVLVGHAPGIRIDNGDDKLLRPGDPHMLRYARFQQQFGRDDAVLVALHPDDVFSERSLDTLRTLHQELEATVPHLREVRSLLNARVVRDLGDALRIDRLLDPWPGTPAEREAVRARALASPLYRNALLSDDGGFTVLFVVLERVSSAGEEPDPLAGFDDVAPESVEDEPPLRFDPATEAGVRAVHEVVARVARTGIPIHVTGGPAIASRLNEVARRDMARFLGLALVGVVVLLALLFRRISAVTLPVLVVVATVGSTLGAMAISGTPISSITQVVPSFLFVVGVCDAIHVLALVYRRMGEGAARDDAIVFAFEHSGLAILLTSVTTAAGLLSFAVAEVQPVVAI